MERSIFKYNSAMALLVFGVYNCWLFPLVVVGQTTQPSINNNIDNIDWKSWKTSNSINNNNNSGNVITVELSETPTFLCTTDLCTQRVREEQERVITEFQTHLPGTTVVATAGKIVNAVFLRLPTPTNEENQRRSLLLEKNTIDNHNIQGIKHISSHSFYKPRLTDAASHENTIQSSRRRTNIDVDDKFCVTGKGIKVAILDSGIDYTHRDLGGLGTRHAYKEAFGETSQSPEHTHRDGLFPTDTVVEGYDFVGETQYLPFILLNGNSVESENNARPDDDPIDRQGHGTLVASTLLKVAPHSKLIAIKTCSDICPSFALILGIEYALDPNQDGSTDDAVDIINMSLAMEWTSALSHMETVAIERAYSLGVLTVVAAGNNGNIGYIGGGFGKSPHPMTVAASGPSTSRDVGTLGSNKYNSGFVRSYSSRYPGENNSIKPDIAAPDGLLAARAGSGFRRKSARGTSFSAPLVAGYAALLKERCNNCSPLALKALLMNNAFRDIRYESSSSEKAPITLVGSGEVRINKSLDADFWAYDTRDVQPSISLGLIDAAVDTVVRRTIQIHSLIDATQVIQVDSLFRDSRDEKSGAVTISINPPSVTIGNCGVAIAEVEFRIDASKAPNNHFGHSYDEEKSALELDKNEFDGHITLTSLETGKDIALPFHMLLRKASHTTISSNQKLPWQPNTKSSTIIEITNSGAGVAQIDAFNLIAVSPDQPEATAGEPRQNDFRSIGFRSRNIDWQGCKSVFEFSINTWERHDHFSPINIGILFDSDRDGAMDYELTFTQEVKKIITISSGDVSCNHLPYDDASNTANTIIRVCSEDIGDPDIFDAAFYIWTPPYNVLNATDKYLSQGIHSSFSAPSRDILPGGALSLTVSGSGTGTGPLLDQRPFGLQIITNADRGSGKTGASTLETETHLLMVEGWELFKESTPDEDHIFPVAEDTTGPECFWKSNLCDDTLLPTPRMEYLPTSSPAPTAFTIPEFSLITATPTCEIEELPREEVPQITGPHADSPSSSSSHIWRRHYPNCFFPFLMAVFIGYICIFY